VSNLLVTVTNLFRDITVAAAFGAGPDSDTFFLAISVPVYLLTASSNAFRSVAVPALEAARTGSDTEYHAVGQRLVVNILWGVAIVAIGLCMAACVAYAACRVYDQTAFWTRVALFLAAIMPMYAGASLVELLQGPLQVSGRFLLPNLLRLGLPVGIVAGVLLQSASTLKTVAVDGTIGACSAALIAGYLLRTAHFLPAGSTPGLPVEIRRSVVAGFRALMLATCITYSRPIIDQWMAGFLGAGATSMLGYASRITVAIASLAVGPVSQVLLIHFSRLAHQGNESLIQSTYRLLFRVAPWIGCIVTLAVWLMSNFVVRMLYQHGKFDGHDARAVAELMNYYALQFPLFWSGIASFTLISALSMNPVFIRIGVILVVVNVIGNVTLIKLLGLNGIAASTNLVYLVSVLLLNLVLMRRKAISLDWSDCRAALLPVVILAVEGAVIWYFNLQVDPSNNYGRMLGGVGTFAVFVGLGVIFLKPNFKPSIASKGPRFMLL